MQIISNRRLLFQDIEYSKNEAGTIIALEKDSIIVNPNEAPQIVPDWVKKTKLFDLAVADGNVLEVSVSAVPTKTKKADSNIKFEAKKIPEAEVVGAVNVATNWPKDTGLASK